MICNMYVKNFILIDELSLDFTNQFSCFSGETGAGKSLLIDAIASLCGEKTSPSYIQKGSEKAFIEATIQIHKSHPSYEILSEAGFELEDDSFVISREFNIHNKSVNKINYRNVTLSLFKSVMIHLVDIHSQHDNQYLLNKKHHLHLLDNYVQEEALLAEVKQKYQDYDSANKKLSKLLNKEEQDEDLDYLNFQLDEINTLDLQENEVEELQTKEKEMSSYEKEVDIINEAVQSLKGMENYQIYESAKALEKLESLKLKEYAQQLLNAYYLIDEQIELMSSYQSSMEFNAYEFDQIQLRLFEVNKLLRKHGPTYTELVKNKHDIEDKIYAIVNAQACIDQLTLTVNTLYKEYTCVALNLQNKRKEKALELQTQIEIQLIDLSLPDAVFVIRFDEKESSTGLDQIEFMISMNKGESIKPLAKVASGGELSRLMLGLKTIFSQLSNVNTLIFDEIDNGVSGHVAYMIGKKMNAIAKYKQVFCVTHLAPVACWANHHYLVEKTTQEDKTISNITCLNEEQTITQLAMITFAKLSEQALLASKELYESCINEK